ncbi:MAG: adenylate kinase [Candidatus Micrarchaeia archaeon]
MRLVFLGAPGAGKGTHAKKLAEKLGIPQISTGDIFRANLAQGTELGRKAESFMKKGELVPDYLVVSMVEERLSQADARKGFILDGFPRTIPQAEALQEILARRGWRLDAVLNISIPIEDAVKRISMRRTCEKCGAIYNLAFPDTRPKQEGVCDKCGGKLVQRADEEEATVRERMRVYEKQTAPLIEYYEKKGLLKTVNTSNNLSADQTFNLVLKALGLN